jgi:hypothetical protein
MYTTRFALLATAALTFLAPTTTGCLPLLLGDGGKRTEACKAAVDQLRVVEPAPPARGFDGRWHCMWTASQGEQVSENLEFIVHGAQVTIAGRDNYGNNIAEEATISGAFAVAHLNETAAFKVAVDPSGRLLDGKLIHWEQNYNVCHQTRYICKR